ETFVTREEFIPAIPRKRNLHMLRRKLRHQKRRDRRAVSKRLIKIPSKTRDQRGGIRPKNDFVMLSAVSLRDQPGGGKLVIFVFLEAYGKCLDRRVRLRRHRRHFCHGTDSTAQECAQRH